MPGFEVVEARMPKCGIRGTATARLAFHDMRVPTENVLGQVGKGLRVALTVLDFGRTTFGASCTGAAKTCLRAAATHAKKRVQFEQPLGRVRAGQEEDRLHGRPRLRHGGDDGRVRRLHRPRLRGLHARNRHAQGLVHRGAVADRQRHDADLRRQGLLHRRAATSA